MITINVAQDFSRIPGARFPEEGDFSGQDFRTNILSPLLRKAIESHDKLRVILDGTAGLGTSFLEESFGGLIRNDGFSLQEIMDTIEFVSDEDPEYIEEITEYLKSSNEQKK